MNEVMDNLERTGESERNMKKLMKTIQRMNFGRTIVSWLLVCAMMVGVMPVISGSVYAETASGTWGDLTWSFDESTGTLTIKGKGEMNDFSEISYGMDSAWRPFNEQIKNVIIGDGITSIGNRAFTGTSSMIRSSGETRPLFSSTERTNIVSSINEEEHVFSFVPCSNMISVVIPDSVKRIGESAFSGCNSLTDVEIPDSVTSIEEWAFFECSSLTNIMIPDSVMSIGEASFFFCSSLTSIKIPDRITSIEPYLFCDCSSLTNIIIPDGITSFGSSAFSGCSSLTAVTIPDSVTSFGRGVFSGCSNLKSVALPDKVINTDLYGMFSGCNSLETIKLPDNITTIESYAFQKCKSLTTITIPQSVKEIGYSSFFGCISLSDVFYEGTEDQWEKIVIDNNNEELLNARIHYHKNIPSNNALVMTTTSSGGLIMAL